MHDRARPEVAVAGLKAVRELCARAPLVMDADLLSDLAAYRKSRDKEVASAARSLVSLFREVNPALLAKRERGRGADLEAAPAAFGAADVATRVLGADLLEAEEEKKRKRREEGGGESDDDEDEDEEGWSDDDDDEEEEEEESDDDGEGGSGESEEEDEEEEEEASDDDEAAPLTPPPAKKQALSAVPLQPAVDSLATLKRALAEAKAKKAAAAAAAEEEEEQEDEEAKKSGDGAGDDKNETATAIPSSLPLEAGRFLDDADFRRIRELRRERLVESALSKHGLKSASKRARAEADAGADADAALAAARARSAAPERRVDPDSLLGRARGRRDKAARMASVMEGREGREFGAAAGKRKAKAGGLSNREKQKRKAMPLAARSAQARKRAGAGRSKRAGKAGKGKFKG